MTLKYRVSHRTSVTYAALVRLARFNLRLKPAEWPGQVLGRYALIVTPTPASMTTLEGPYVVNVSRLDMARPLKELVIVSDFDIDITPPLIDMAAAPDIAAVRRAALKVPDLHKTAPAAYLFPSRMAPLEGEIAAWGHEILSADRNILEAGLDLARTIKRQFRYDPDATESDTPAIDAFRARHGVCQDFAHVMIIALRAQGLAAAYVSGYLRTLPPPGKARLVGTDATHAWVNLWCGPDLGWIGLDPTNGVLAGADHIFTAMGRDYADVAPIDGVFMGGRGQRLRVGVDVVEA